MIGWTVVWLVEVVAGHQFILVTKAVHFDATEDPNEPYPLSKIMCGVCKTEQTPYLSSR